MISQAEPAQVSTPMATAAAVTMGVLTLAGSAWLIKWVPAYAPDR